MQCPYCGRYLQENLPGCPFCGQALTPDPFGYRNAAQPMPENPPKKKNTGKIVLIVCGALAGVALLVALLLFLLSGSGDNQEPVQYDGSFTIATDFTFSVTDEGNQNFYTVYVRPENGKAQSATLRAGEETAYSLAEGVYTLRVESSSGGGIMLEMTASADCAYHAASLAFDKRQIATTDGDGTQTAAPEPEKTAYVYPSNKVVYINGEKFQGVTLSVDENGQITETLTSYEIGSRETRKLISDESGRLTRMDMYYQSAGESSATLRDRYTYTYDGDLLSSYDRSGDFDTTKAFTYENGRLVSIIGDDRSLYGGVMEIYYTYNESSDLLSEYTYLGDSDTPIWFTTYQYDDNHVLTQYYHESAYDGDYGTTTLEYNDDGLLSRKIDVSTSTYSMTEGEVVYLYTYNEAGQQTKVEKYGDGELLGVEVTEYGADGNPVLWKSTSYNDEGELIFEYHFSDYITVNEAQKNALDTMSMTLDSYTDGFTLYDWTNFCY